jgi:hypothetical protein
MAEKNLVDETLIQIQNLEDVINENAKEILASTMKEEISELVKESMKTDEESEESELEEAEDELEMIDTEDESEEEESEDEFEMEDSEDDDESEEMDMSMDFDTEDDMMDVKDLTDVTDDSEIYKVFKDMSDEDELVVVPDGDYLHVSHKPSGDEYLVQTESEEDEYELEESEDEDTEYEYELEEGDDEDSEYELEEGMPSEMEKSEGGFNISDEMGETIYELELEEESDDEFEFELEEESEEDNEGYGISEAKSSKKMKMETKESMKPKVGKGAQTGKASKFSYKKSKGGFKEDMKHASPTKGTGKPKFEFKEGEVDLSKSSKKEAAAFGGKKSETKEAARTYGMGWRKGALPKGARTGSKIARQDESVMEEVEMLRAKNEEYRKALNLFREKLNEVAIFNSNLAYATRLFTEHSTSKHEKINILRRFDSAETLKESKALYKTIKDELSQGTKSTPISESIERVIDREPQSGSAVNLIESKTYENPQFLRMKDIMSKIAK